MISATSFAQEHRALPRAAVDLGFVALVVFLASYLGIVVLTREGGVAPIWIADAFIIYFALSRPREETAQIIAVGVASRFVAGIAIGSTLAGATVYSLCNLLEILVVALPLRSLDAHRDFARPKALLWFYALAAGPAPLVAALPAAFFRHYFYGDGFIPIAVNWYAADGLGLIVLVPILFTVRTNAFLRMFRRDQLAKTLMYISTVLAAVVINVAAKGYPLAFLFFPAVLFLTFQRSFEGGAIGLAIVSAHLISPIFFGRPMGSLHGYNLRDQMLIIEIFIAVIGFSVVLVGAALEERRRLEVGLSLETQHAESAREEAVVAKEAAEKASRMKSMFLATMSHELRTPLNAIIGFSQLMETETFGPLGDPHYSEYTGLIQKAGRHLLELINDILDMSKIEAGKFELHRQEIDIRSTVEECVLLMRERARHAGVTVRADLPGDALELNVDVRAVKQILLNLLSNAVKFTPPRGRVTVRAARSAESLLLSVADTGVGIPADQLYRLGNPFVQLRDHAGSAHEGTGLGLALVRSLAEMHGGSFRIESVQDVGTTVSIEIPFSPPVSVAA